MGSITNIVMIGIIISLATLGTNTFLGSFVDNYDIEADGVESIDQTAQLTVLMDETYGGLTNTTPTGADPEQKSYSIITTSIETIKLLPKTINIVQWQIGTAMKELKLPAAFTGVLILFLIVAVSFAMLRLWLKVDP